MKNKTIEYYHLKKPCIGIILDKITELEVTRKYIKQTTNYGPDDVIIAFAGVTRYLVKKDDEFGGKIHIIDPSSIIKVLNDKKNENHL
jgi:hypothetical protein